MDVELLDEELANIADEERQIEEMDYSKLSHPEAVLSCWSDSSIDLVCFGESEIERYYLAAIENVRNRTGSPNFWLADYIWRLEKRLSKIEQNLKD